MSIFGKEIDDKAAGGGDWLKGSDFEGKGLVVQYVSHTKKESKYGATEKDGLFKRGILEEGELFSFVFNTKDGQRTFDTTSFPFFIGMKEAEIQENGWYLIKRTGKGDETRYTVTPVNDEQAKKTSLPDEPPF